MNLTKIETNFKKKLFFHQTENLYFEKTPFPLERSLIVLYPDIEYQEILGFGGALTESSSYNFSLLPKEKQSAFLNEYFDPTGINYSFCRICIGSCDFSLSSYSYLYQEDISYFSIARDEKYVIPFIKAAQKINPNLILLASPWSPPAFMKDNQNLTSGGKLLRKYKNLWANYLVNYLKAYQKEGISVSFMTVQNEPQAIQTWESCLYSAEEESDLIKHYIYPLFQKNHISTKLLIWDHNKENLFTRARTSLSYQNCNSLIAGLAFHWYSGDHFENIQLVNQLYPTKLLIHTKGCTGYSNFRKSDEIINAEIYGHDILNDLNSGCHAFVDWNVLLDYKGGPNHKNNFCNAPIMLNRSNTDYIKNLSFYYIGHFSKYISPHSKRIAYTKFTNQIEVTAFKNLNNTISIILLNTTDSSIEFNLLLGTYLFHDSLDTHSIVTLLISS